MIAMILAAALSAFAAEPPASRPDGDPPGHGSRRLGVEATKNAHYNFNGDACLVSIDVVAFRAPDPALPAEDTFTYSFRSAMLNKSRWELRICLPESPGTPDPRCKGDWETVQAKADGPVKCVAGRVADTGEVLALARKKGLPKAPVDGLQFGLRGVAKSGKGLAKEPKLKGKLVWLIESREQCQAFDAISLAALYKGSCKKLGWPEPK